MTELIFEHAGDHQNVSLTLEALDLAACRYTVQPTDWPGPLATLLFPGLTAESPPIPPPGGVVEIPPYACDILRAALSRARRASLRWRGELGAPVLGLATPAPRASVVSLARAYTGHSVGSAPFEEVTQGRGSIKGYSACGDFWNFILFRLGCREPSIVNRAEPAAGLKWHVSENLSRPVAGATKVGAWVIAKPGLTPKPGDLLLVGQYPVEIEHASVLLSISGATWEVGEYGQVDEKGNPASKLGRPVRSGDRLGKRKIVGWIDIDAIPKSVSFNGAGGPAVGDGSSFGAEIAAAMAVAAAAAALVWIL